MPVISSATFVLGPCPVMTRDGWLYVLRDNRIEFIAHDEVPERSESIFLDIRNPAQPRRYFDDLQVYADQYLFPPRNISVGEYVANYRQEGYQSYPEFKTGIVVRGRGVTLSDIAQAIGVVNSRFADMSVVPGLFTDSDHRPVRKFVVSKYYLDVRVVDAAGAPVSGAQVHVANEVDDASFPPENMVAEHPYTGDGDALDGGEFACYYHHRRIVHGQPLHDAVTGDDGHTPLPSDTAGTLIVADRVKKIEDSPSGVRIRWRSHWEDTKYVQFDVYDPLCGNVVHQVAFLDLQGGQSQHVRVTYDPLASAIRLVLTDASASVLWDTGDLPVDAIWSPLVLDQIGVETRQTGATNAVFWDGGSVIADTEVYRGHLVLAFDNMQVTADGRTIEDNDYAQDPGLLADPDLAVHTYGLPESTDGLPFVWEFDVELTQFEIDGPWVAVWLRDSRDVVDESEKTVDFTYSIRAEKDGVTCTATNIAPDGTWYRPDPLVPTCTVEVGLASPCPPARVTCEPSSFPDGGVQDPGGKGRGCGCVVKSRAGAWVSGLVWTLFLGFLLRWRMRRRREGSDPA